LGEAEDRAHHLSGAAYGERPLRECVVGTVDDGVAIKEHQKPSG
jgi:hypothetical protein